MCGVAARIDDVRKRAGRRTARSCARARESERAHRRAPPVTHVANGVHLRTFYHAFYTRAYQLLTHNLPGRSVPSSHAHVASEAGLRQPRRLVKLETRVAEGFARRVHNAGFHVGQTVRKDE